VAGQARAGRQHRPRPLSRPGGEAQVLRREESGSQQVLLLWLWGENTFDQSWEGSVRTIRDKYFTENHGQRTKNRIIVKEIEKKYKTKIRQKQYVKNRTKIGQGGAKMEQGLCKKTE
jgi:hypothetical protein